ncbi:MAG TPA: glycosyltransferase [Flavisolibacter sp.]|nr:glycosyltransferase [Flavisolibacter sp.]
MKNHLHIVCLDAPSPPDYGGAIDMFYKIKALAEIGYKITLHYFNYHPKRDTTGLEPFCEAIYNYKRKALYGALPVAEPYIITSRANKDLIARLNADTNPVLLEGLHCAGVIRHLKNRERVVIRMHNEEASYYHHLFRTTASILKKIYYQRESKLLSRYQNKMDKEVQLACLSESDIVLFDKGYGFRQTHFIPCFIPWQFAAIKTGKGAYCLYHGNLRVSENEEAALWLIKHVFSTVRIPLIVAGKGISKRLKEAAKNHRQISLVTDPTIPIIDGLIRAAQINVLPSMNSTGVKLKLLNALLNGRHCITNSNGIKGSHISEGVSIKEAAEDWQKEIATLMQEEFTATQIKGRLKILRSYNNALNAHKLSELW